VEIPLKDFQHDSKLHKVDPEQSPLITNPKTAGTPYILSTKSGVKIASQPHILGDPLKTLCIENAREFVTAANSLDLLNSNNLGVLQILRGAPGYRLTEVLPADVPKVNVRTEYIEDGYRSHSDDPRSIKVTYRDTPAKELKNIETLIVPDTFATGRSAEAALLDLFESGVFPVSLILYGFIALPALERVGKICVDRGIKFSSFTLCDLSQLANNNYDMPVYGLDESLMRTANKKMRLGSIISLETLSKFLTCYIPGLDQPGDWSERQISLYNGIENEHGDIAGHLSKSITLINSLREVNSGHEWYSEDLDQIAVNELMNLKATLVEYS
jgi:hypothetical protein